MSSKDDNNPVAWKKAYDMLNAAWAGDGNALAKLENALARGREKQIAAARLSQGENRNVNVSLAAKKALEKPSPNKDWKYWTFVPYVIMASGLPLWWLIFQIFQYAFVPGLACLYSSAFMVGAIVAGLIWRWKFKSDGGGKATKSKM